MDSHHTVDELVTTKFVLNLQSEEGVAIPGSTLTTATVTLYDAVSGSIVNGLRKTDLLSNDNSDIDENGVLTWVLRPEDNQLLCETVPVRWNADDNYESTDDGNLKRKAASGNEGVCESLAALVCDGYVEFSAEAAGGIAIGLTSDEPEDDHTTIDYLLEAGTGGVLKFHENGSLVTSGESFSASDLLRIERDGQSIVYKKNGTIVRTATTKWWGPLAVCGWINVQNRTATSVKVARSVTYEKHIALIEWTYAAGEKRGKHEAMFLVVASENVP